MSTVGAIPAEERSILRWGGLAGLLGAVLFILSWVVVIVGPVGMEEPATLAAWVARFPDIQVARVVENGVYLAATILEVMLFVTLYRALRRENTAEALFGSTLGVLGLVVFMVGALPHVALAPLSDLYHTPGATAADQAALALMWQATWGIFDAILAVGFVLVPAGILLVGGAMLKNPAFGRVVGWLSVVLGVVGLAAGSLQMAAPGSMVGAGAFFACLIFYLVLGWRVFALSRTNNA